MARSKLNKPDPLLLRVNRRRCLLTGIFLSVMGFCFLAYFGAPGPILSLNDVFETVASVFGLIFLGIGVFNFGLARRLPVALRLDADGISGYHVHPARWSEIRSVQFLKIKNRYGRGNSQEEEAIAFVMKDPETFFANQSAWARFKRSMHKNLGADMLVTETNLDVSNIYEVFCAAQEFKNGSRSG